MCSCVFVGSASALCAITYHLCPRHEHGSDFLLCVGAEMCAATLSRMVCDWSDTISTGRLWVTANQAVLIVSYRLTQTLSAHH